MGLQQMDNFIERLPVSIVLYIMDFLSLSELADLRSIFLEYLNDHGVNRTAITDIYHQRDISIAAAFPKSRMRLHICKRAWILDDLEPCDYHRVVSLRTVLPHAAPLFMNLRELDISYTKTEYVPRIPSLTRLNCSYTNVTKIPSILTELEYLDAWESKLIELPSTLVKLKHLDIYSTYVCILPSQYTELEWLRCSYTFIVQIPETYKKLSYLESMYSMLYYIPKLPLLKTVKTDNQFQKCYEIK